MNYRTIVFAAAAMLGVAALGSTAEAARYVVRGNPRVVNRAYDRGYRQGVNQTQREVRQNVRQINRVIRPVARIWW
jgi:hypothetical protein